MQFSQEIQRIFLGLLIAFTFVGLSATYWAISGPYTILQREDNPRIIEDIARLQRGRIYDSNETLLVQTSRTNGDTSRDYLHDSTYSVIGYYSLRYGESGVEFAFNDMLNGDETVDTLEAYVVQNVLNIPTVGADIQLTLDLEIQDTLVELIGGQQGAGVVMNAQNGNILALASLPTFDPNTLDENWDVLTQAEGDPFFNRALQGQYQPGGVMYTLWMSQALLTRYDTSQRIANGDDTVSLGEDTFINCVLEPPTSNLTLLESYTFGCPVPFAVYRRTTSERTFDDLVQNFSLNAPHILNGFPVPEPISATSGTQAEVDPFLLELRDTLGQGNITVTPLHIAGVMSAVAQNGNAFQPTILKNIKSPDDDQWQSTEVTQSSVPMMTSITARQLRATLSGVWQTIQPDTYPDPLSVGATIATSQSGEETQQWIVGFVRDEQGGRVAFVVLFENTMDVQSIITAGQTLIQTIINEMMPA